MEARLDTARKFFYLPSSLDLGLDGLLELRVYKNDFSSQIVGSPFAAALVVAPASVASLGVYESELVSFPEAGTYHLLWRCDSPLIQATETVVVLDAPTGDDPSELNQKARYDTPGYVAASDVVLRVIKDGAQVGSTYATAASGVAGIYLTTDAFSLGEEGHYLLVWSSESGGHSFTRIEQRLIVTAPLLRTTTIFVIDMVSSPDVPVSGVDVLVSTPEAAPVQQTRTGAAGKVQFQLHDGSYVVSLRKTGTVFTRNNIAITVTADGDNTTYIIADPFSPTFDPAPQFSAGALSLMTLHLVDGSGGPVRGVRVYVAPTLAIASTPAAINNATETAGLIGGVLMATTDGNGYAELNLLRGQTVTAAIEASSFRRTFVVPDSSTFNLLAVTPLEDDPLAVVVNTTTAAEKRS